MKRVGFILKVKPDRLEEYKRQHEQVWPDMLQALREAGWHNYSLFVRDDGLLFGYFETPDSLAGRPGADGRDGDQYPLAGVHGALFRVAGQCAPG